MARKPRGADGPKTGRSILPDLMGTGIGCGGLEPQTKQGGDRAARDHELGPGERWFAVQSRPHREAVAVAQLHNQGFRVFLPLRSKTWRHARRIETRFVPFFPSYLFVALDLDRDRWRSVNGTFGVQRLVMAGDDSRPVPLPRGFIEALQGQADDRGYLRLDELLRVGQTVRIVSGPFGDRIGELVHLDDSGRVRLLIELLGGRVPVRLLRGQVLAAG
jgi:transcription antitermination factor NusG